METAPFSDVRRTRAPSGSQRPILVRLQPHEYAHVRREAQLANMTLAAATRALILRGLRCDSCDTQAKV